MQTAIVKAVKAKKPSATPEAKAKQLAKGKEAIGEALATCLFKTITEQASKEEEFKTRLARYVSDVQALTREGHVAFREQLDTELATFRAIKKAMGDTKAGKEGLKEEGILGAYGYASIPVRISQWRAISKAMEKGLRIGKTTGFNKVITECVAFNNSVAAKAVKSVITHDDGTEEEVTVSVPSPAKKVGRKKKAELSLLEQVQALCKGAEKAELETIAAWCLKQAKQAPEAAPL